MLKGLMQIEVLEITSDHFKGDKFHLKIEGGDCNFVLDFPDLPTTIHEPPRYFPLTQQIQISLYFDPSDTKVGYFKLPVGRIYQHPYPNTNNIINVHCVWLQKTTNKVMEGDSATIKLSLHYLKDVYAKLDILIERALLTNDTETFGKMDPFVECSLGQIKAVTTVQEQAGKIPVWNQTLSFAIEQPPSEILFKVQDKDMTSDDLVGVAKINPHHCNMFKIKEPNQKYTLKLWVNGEQEAGTLYISTTFTIQ